MNPSCHTCIWVMAHTWTNHITHMNELYRSLWRELWSKTPVATRMSHAKHTNESWHKYEWVIAYTWMIHVTQMNESWHTYEWFMAHIWMSHGTNMNESLHTHGWFVSHKWVPHTGNHRISSRKRIHKNVLWYIYIYISTHKKTTHLNESLKLLGNPIRKGRPLPLIHWYNISQMLACQQIYYAHWLCGWFWEI